MSVTDPVTSNEVVIRMRATEREAFRKAKDKAGLTYAEYALEVKDGKRKRLRVPAAAQKSKHVSWCVAKFYVTAEQKAFLEADAERRGTTVSKAVRADIFEPPKTQTPPAKAKSLHISKVISGEVRDYLAAVRSLPEYEYTKLMSEQEAFVVIAGVLFKREALSNL